MAKVWARLSLVTKLAIFIFIGGIVYLMMPESTPTTVKKAAPVAAKKTSGDDVQFTDADMKASFASLMEPLKDSFKPLVVRTNVGGGAASSGKEDAVPAYMAGGDGNWIYTGTASVDGVPTVLLENSSTGEGIYLKDGELWKQLIVQAIGPDTVSIRGTESGEDLTLRLATTTTEEDVKPVNPTPALQGPIGNITISPTAGGVPPTGGPPTTIGTDQAPSRPGR